MSDALKNFPTDKFFFDDDINEFQAAAREYHKCWTTYFNANRYKCDLKEELKRTDLNSVCTDELTNFRAKAATLGYKEIIGANPLTREIPKY
jgi:hypothetical protein